MTRIATGLDVFRGERGRYGKDYQWFVHQRMDLTALTLYNLVSKPLSVNTILHEILITMCMQNPAQHGDGVVIIGLVGSPNPTQLEIEKSEPIIAWSALGVRGYWNHAGCGVTENWILHKDPEQHIYFSYHSLLHRQTIRLLRL